MGGTQRLTPRLQLVASGATDNLEIPNEDARAVDLEDSNLFALNRFPGYDRWENGPRVTYGVDWGLDLPGIAVRTTIGQSYRLDDKPSILPPGHRPFRPLLRLCRPDQRQVRAQAQPRPPLPDRQGKPGAAGATRSTPSSAAARPMRRSAISASTATSTRSIEDLRDREEIRLGGRVRFKRYWSIFGSTVIDLTDAKESPLSSADGYEPVRHRIGISYDDDCLEIGVTWRRDYDRSGDIDRGNTFQFRVALKNLGR